MSAFLYIHREEATFYPAQCAHEGKPVNPKEAYCDTFAVAAALRYQQHPGNPVVRPAETMIQLREKVVHQGGLLLAAAKDHLLPEEIEETIADFASYSLGVVAMRKLSKEQRLQTLTPEKAASVAIGQICQ